MTYKKIFIISYNGSDVLFEKQTDALKYAADIYFENKTTPTKNELAAFEDELLNDYEIFNSTQPNDMIFYNVAFLNNDYNGITENSPVVSELITPL